MNIVWYCPMRQVKIMKSIKFTNIILKFIGIKLFFSNLVVKKTYTGENLTGV